MNEKKTKHLSITSRRDDFHVIDGDYYTNINKQKLEYVHSYNCLRVIVDNKLSLSYFVELKYAKVNLKLCFNHVLVLLLSNLEK